MSAHELLDRSAIWARIAAPLPADAIEWRQDGRPAARGGQHFARFVAYVTAQYVRERLDDVVPGEWDLTLELLSTPESTATSDGEAAVAFKARLQVLGVIREDVGMGPDHKQAATDAFKRAAVRFGIAHELYAYEQNWVPVDGDGKFAKPLEDPGTVYARRVGAGARAGQRSASTDGGGVKNNASPRAHPPAAGDTPASSPAPAPAAAPATAPATAFPRCPKCDGKMWDNRVGKRNPKAPDFKCQDKACDGVIWPMRETAAATASVSVDRDNDAPPVWDNETDELPF